MPWVRIVGVVSFVLLAAGVARADDWPQWLGPQRDGVWREQGTLDKFPEGGPKVAWRIAVGGGYAGPAVAGGKVYVMDRQLKAGAARPNDPFDTDRTVAGTERVLCVNAADGKEVWKHEYECPYNLSYGSGPRTTPAIDGDRVYTLGAEGHLKCLKVENGEVVWEKKLSSEQRPTPLWGFAGHPLIDGEKVICTTSGKVMSAFNKRNGDLIWEAVEVTNRQFGPGYAPPVIYEAGGKRQLIAFPPDALVSLDPETGKEYWRTPINPPVQNGVSIATPMKLGDILIASSFYGGTIAMQLDAAEPKAELLYKRGDHRMRKTEALQTLMSTPVLRDGHLYGVCAGGELRCIDPRTGERIWETTQATLRDGQAIPWTTAFIVPNGPEKCFIANDQGELIIANLTPKGYQELSRAKLLEPTNRDARRPVLWCHPAFANKSIYWRNDKEMICVSLEG